LVNKPAGLITTVRVETSPSEQRFIIRGEPLIQGLSWLTWGPLATLIVIVILTGLAVALNVKEEKASVRALFIFLFLASPTLAWVGATFAANHFSKKHIEAEREAEARQCLIRLQPERGEFFYQTGALVREERLAYERIRKVMVDSAIGARDGKAVCLLLETDYGPLILLDETLGTQAQKVDLARQIQYSLNLHTDYRGKDG
jgi:hypothetical protein